MIEAGNLPTVRSLAVPDIDLTHEAASRDQIVRLRTELTLHEVFIEDLDVGYFYVTLLIYAADASDHV